MLLLLLPSRLATSGLHTLERRMMAVLGKRWQMAGVKGYKGPGIRVEEEVNCASV